MRRATHKTDILLNTPLRSWPFCSWLVHKMTMRVTATRFTRPLFPTAWSPCPQQTPWHTGPSYQPLWWHSQPPSCTRLAQLRNSKFSLLYYYVKKISPTTRSSSNCPHCNSSPHDTQHLISCRSIPTTISLIYGTTLLSAPPSCTSGSLVCRHLRTGAGPCRARVAQQEGPILLPLLRWG